MPEQSTDVMERCAGQLPFRALVQERVLLATEERLMGVHAAAVLTENRLGHEGRVQPESTSDVLHYEAKSRDVVGRPQRFGIPEIDLVLTVRDFVMRGLDL